VGGQGRLRARVIAGVSARARPGRDQAAVPGDVGLDVRHRRLWATTGALELGVFALLLASLLRGEFRMHEPKSPLLSGLALAFFTFACLSFGRTTAGTLGGTASLHTYFGSTAIVFLLVFCSRRSRRGTA
jgi:hypothetical protein